MRSIVSLSALTAAALLLTACGENSASDSDTPACPVIEGETHLAVADSDDGASLMLHVVGTECLVVGPNTMAIHGYLKDDGHSMAPGYLPAGMLDPNAPKYIVESVVATMPSMGHGTHEAPVVPADSNQFEVNFQMAGEWLIDVEFHAQSTMAVTDTVTDHASFTVTVQ